MTRQRIAAAVFLMMFVGLARPSAVTGQGTPTVQDTPEIQALRERAEGGDPSAQYILGAMYADGRGVPQDDAQAVAWFGSAADQGHVAAQSNLGVMYFNGKGVPRDYVEAHKWLNLAASRVSDADQTRYTEALDLLAKRMSPEQIADAQQRARVWQPAEQKTRRPQRRHLRPGRFSANPKQP